MSKLPQKMKQLTVAIIGESASGKSILIEKMMSGNFIKDYIPTKYEKSSVLTSNKYFDTQLECKFTLVENCNLQSTCYDGIVLVVDACAIETKNITILNKIKSIKDLNIPFVVCFNKIDLTNKHGKSSKKNNLFKKLKHMQINIIEMSCKLSYNCEKPFQVILNLCSSFLYNTKKLKDKTIRENIDVEIQEQSMPKVEREDNISKDIKEVEKDVKEITKDVMEIAQSVETVIKDTKKVEKDIKEIATDTVEIIAHTFVEKIIEQVTHGNEIKEHNDKNREEKQQEIYSEPILTAPNEIYIDVKPPGTLETELSQNPPDINVDIPSKTGGFINYFWKIVGY